MCTLQPWPYKDYHLWNPPGFLPAFFPYSWRREIFVISCKMSTITSPHKYSLNTKQSSRSPIAKYSEKKTFHSRLLLSLFIVSALYKARIIFISRVVRSAFPQLFLSFFMLHHFVCELRAGRRKGLRTYQCCFFPLCCTFLEQFIYRWYLWQGYSENRTMQEESMPLAFAVRF